MTSRYLIIVFVCCMINMNLYADTPITDEERRVPIVIYTPFNFYRHLMDAYQFHSAQDYYVITKKNIYIYDNQYGIYDSRSDYQERTLRLTKMTIPTKFRETIFTNDSCFFFSPTHFNKYDNQYLGIKKGQTIRFIDNNGKWYESLEDLLLSFSNADFLDTYFDIYINEVRNALYSRRTRNTLYKITSVAFKLVE